jgi:ABC-type glycerol-3-phosphate transport system permease component
VLIFVGLLMLYPLAWMFSASFKPNHEIFTTSLFPGAAYGRPHDRRRSSPAPSVEYQPFLPPLSAPLAWMFSASFKPNHEIFTTLGLWPTHATWDGFITTNISTT